MKQKLRSLVLLVKRKDLKMNKTAIITALAVFTVLAAVLTSFLRIRSAEAHMPQIELPAREADTTDVIGEVLAGTKNASLPLEITKENVLTLAASMKRPAEYYAEMTVTLYWDGGETSTQSRVWRKNGLSRVSYVEGGVSYVCLISGENTWIWEQGSSRYNSFMTGDFTADSAAHLPCYEDLAGLDRSEVTDCGTEFSDGINCLYLRTEENGVIRDWYIELESGLLRRVNEYRDGVLKYSAVASVITAGQLEDSRFLLPDGSSVLPG